MLAVQLQQLHNLEHIQTESYSRSSTRNLNAAMEGEQVNPMAPSYWPEDDNPKSQIPPWESQHDDPESQIPPWAPQLISASQEQDFQCRPSFMLSQPSQQFSFKVPSQASAPTSASTQSTKSYNSSLLSSRNLSVFSGSMPWGTSTAPTSHTPSKCGSNNAYGTQDMDDSQHAPLRRFSQLCELVVLMDHVSGAPPYSYCAHDPCANQPSSTHIQDQHWDNSPSPPPCRVGLCWTRTFSQLPATISTPHTMCPMDAEGGGDDLGYWWSVFKWRWSLCRVNCAQWR